MISVFAIGPQDGGYKPDREDGFLRPINIHSTPYFGGGSKAVGLLS
jgi:hypothetical protein